MTKTKKQLRAEAVESTTERGMTNIEWLYEHDEYLNSFAKLMACLHGFSTDEFTANEWLMQEHANDDSAPEKDVSGGAVDVTTKQPISQFDVPKSEETTENSTAKNEIRDFDDTREKLEADVLKYYTHTTSTLMWPVDANIMKKWVSVSMDTVLEWLDRQDAITRRECDKPNWDYCETCELTAERDLYREKLSRALDLAHEIERLMP